MQAKPEAAGTDGDRIAGGVVLRLATMSDVRGARQLHRAALEALDGTGDVTVDATGAAHLDTAALQILIALRRALAERHRGMTTIGVSEGVHAFLRHAGLEQAVLG